jgi:hypothetical protein
MLTLFGLESRWSIVRFRMAGSLFHSRRFRAKPYTGLDGKPHHEIVPVDGDSDAVSYSSWSEMKEFGHSHGIPDSTWPEFLEHEFAIDVPLDEIESRSNRFRSAASRLDRGDLLPYWLAKMLEYLDRGEYIFFC